MIKNVSRCNMILLNLRTVPGFRIQGTGDGGRPRVIAREAGQGLFLVGWDNLTMARTFVGNSFRAHPRKRELFSS